MWEWGTMVNAWNYSTWLYYPRAQQIYDQIINLRYW